MQHIIHVPKIGYLFNPHRSFRIREEVQEINCVSQDLTVQSLSSVMVTSSVRGRALGGCYALPKTKD
jgi:hypothetical protein